MFLKRKNTVSLKDACDLLEISRPTFNARRTVHRLREHNEGRRIFFDKAEVLQKLYVPSHPGAETYNFTTLECSPLHKLNIDPTTLDLRRINRIDAFGAIELLCEVFHIARKNGFINLITHFGHASRFLRQCGFFLEVTRRLPEQSFITSPEAPEQNNPIEAVILPISLVGYKGAERPLTEEAANRCLELGFNPELAGGIGWILGELSDNAHTHSKGPCHILVMIERSARAPIIQIAAADLGAGIHETIRRNKKYSRLKPEAALLTAFKSNVSSWPDEHKRGKGLTDIAALTLASRSYFRVESNRIGLLANFASLTSEIDLNKACATAPGTRFCVTLSNPINAEISREEADRLIDEALRRLA